MHKTFVLDIEASGLSDNSYPIEIAWCNLAQDEYDTFLIKPAENWEFWCENAEMTHGIFQFELDNGISVVDAAEYMNQVFQNATVYSDGLEWDSFWIKRLFEAAGINQAFEVKPVSDLVNGEEFYNRLEWMDQAHRALPDAKQMAGVVCEMLDQK